MNKREIRRAFRSEVFSRDGHQCKKCESKDDLVAHHIIDRKEMPYGGYVKENGITLCPEHHAQAEMFHATGGKEFAEGTQPSDLLALIGSSEQLAREASENLLASSDE